MSRSSHPRLRATAERGYSLIEVLVAVSVVAAIAGSSILGLTRLNHSAALARLQTCASTVAQSKIDRFISVTPFRPDLGNIAPDLAVATTEEGTADVPTVPIYKDPSDPLAMVKGWTVTRITDASTTFGGEIVWAYRCEVTVAYHYRGAPFWVRLSTLRTSD